MADIQPGSIARDYFADQAGRTQEMVVEDESSRSVARGDEILGGIELKRDANQGRKKMEKKEKLKKKSFKEDK